MYSPACVPVLLKQPFGSRQWNLSVVSGPLCNRPVKTEHGQNLSLRELETLARALLAVLLPFLASRIARHKPRLLQASAEFRVQLDQSPRDSMAHCSRLPRISPAVHVD